MAGHRVELEEAALVEQQVDALAGGLAPAGVLALDGALRPGVHDVVLTAVPVGELAGGGVDVGLVRGLSHIKAGGLGRRRRRGGHERGP